MMLALHRTAGTRHRASSQDSTGRDEESARSSSGELAVAAPPAAFVALLPVPPPERRHESRRGDERGEDRGDDREENLSPERKRALWGIQGRADEAQEQLRSTMLEAWAGGHQDEDWC